MATGPTLAKDRDIGFPLGMWSGDDSEMLPPGSYYRSMNTVNRGRLVQCRPGYNTTFTLPDGVLQGLILFKPLDNPAQLVVAVAGKIYYSAAPFDEFVQIPGLSFSPTAPQIYWCPTERSVQRNADGSLTLLNPRPVLMIQDGVTAAGYWDGATSGHLKGSLATPLGKAMAWSGTRLWVARGRQLFASDIADPFSFFEGQYVNATGAFVLPGEITALAELPSVENPVLLCYTDTTTTQFLSHIQQRLLWATTPNFQKVILPNVGAVGQRAVVAHGGLLWWFSQFGFTNLNAAYATHLDSGTDYVDHNMAISKGFLAPDLSVVAAASFEKYLLVSVPYCDWNNRHTWVRDESKHNNGHPSWNSYWVGTRPVEWTSGTVGQESRIFHASVDYDGKNRIWEAFGPTRLDNGCPITWTLETRGMTGGTDSPKEFNWADIWMGELSGVVDLKAGWSTATRGRYKTVLSKRIVSTRGSFSDAVPVRFDKKDFMLRPQVRKLRTETRKLTSPDPLTSCGVESDVEDWTDVGFRFCIIANGPGAIRAVRVFMDDQPERPEGKCEKDETNVRASRFDGADSAGLTLGEVLSKLQAADPIFTASATATATYKGITTVGTGQANSRISQQAADKMAECMAEMRATGELQQLAPGFLGGFKAGC